MDRRISRGFSRLPEGELGAEGCVLLGRREARPFGTGDPGERGPFQGLLVPCSIVPG